MLLVLDAFRIIGASLVFCVFLPSAGLHRGSPVPAGPTSIRRQSEFQRRGTQFDWFSPQ